MTVDEVMRLAEEYRDASTFSGSCVAKKELRAAVSELAAKSAEVERLREALRNLLVMLPSAAGDGEDKERIPVGFCYVRWQDIREAHEALEAK